MKEYVYIIEIDESDAYDTSKRIYDKSFKSYESAKSELLKYFNTHLMTNGHEYFTLKENYQYSSDFDYGASATIEKLELLD